MGGADTMAKAILQETIGDQSSEELIDLTFNQDEMELLEMFKENFIRLRKSRLVENDKLPVIKQINWSEEKGLEFVFSTFDYHDVYEVLMLLRPFILETESASFTKICSIFGKQSTGTLLAKVLKSIGYQYKKGDYQHEKDEKGDYQLDIQLDTKDVSLFNEEALERWLNFEVEECPQDIKSTSLFNEETLKIWLNGKMYHQDMDKSKLIKQIEKSFGEDTTGRIFVSQLSGKIRAIYRLSSLVNLFS